MDNNTKRISRSELPEELLADTLYGSDENCHKTAKLGVEVVSPFKSTKEIVEFHRHNLRASWA